MQNIYNVAKYADFSMKFQLKNLFEIKNWIDHIKVFQ